MIELKDIVTENKEAFNCFSLIVNSKELFSSPIFWCDFEHERGRLTKPSYWGIPVLMPNFKDFKGLASYCESKPCGCCIFRLKDDNCLLKTKFTFEWKEHIDEVKTNITLERSPFIKLSGKCL